MAFCTSCGNEIFSGKVCYGCGTHVDGSPAVSSSPSAPIQQSPQTAIASSEWSPPSDTVGTHKPQGVGGGSPRTLKSRRIVGIAVAGVLAVVVGAVIFLISKESDGSTVSTESTVPTVSTVPDEVTALYQDEFASILGQIEQLDWITILYDRDSKAAQDAFFDAAPDPTANPNGFWNYVKSDGPNWLKQNWIYRGAFDEMESPRLNTLRSKAIALVEGRENLLEIRAAALAHYETWMLYAGKYYDAIDDYVYDTGDSWSTISARNHELLGDQINETFLKLCGLLGDMQPIGGPADYSPRIADLCKR